MHSVISRILDSVKNKLSNVVILGTIKSIKDDNEFQLAEMNTGGEDKISDVENIQQYGLTSNPPKDSEAVLLCPSGSKDSGIIISVGGAKYRIKSLKEGEVSLYSKFGNSITLRSDGSIDINSDQINTGISGLEKSMLGEAFKTYIDSFFNEVFGAWVPVPADGGAVLNALYKTWSTAHTFDNYLSNKNKNA